MPLFKKQDGRLVLQKVTNFKLEKDLQSLIEKNLGPVFNCRFVATEFPTGMEHAGRIDTLALSEDGNPVIIEHKKQPSSELITQSLYYLSWLNDHRGDYQVAAERTLGPKVAIDWDDIRVICISPAYSKFDLHAVRMMGASIELWQYRLFEDGSIHLDEIFRKSTALLDGSESVEEGKNPVMVAAGKKAAIARATGHYDFTQHLSKATDTIRPLVEKLRDYILNLDESIEESPKKLYVAYKVAQNFVCIEVQRHKATLFLKLNPNELKPFPEGARDMTNIGHYGTGDLEYSVKTDADLKEAERLIRMAFEHVGG